MKKFLASFVVVVVIAAAFITASPSQAVTGPAYDVSGAWVVAFEYQGSDYAHDMMLAQDGTGMLTGSGGYPAGGAHVYTWVLDSGSVTGSTIEFTAHYTASADAVTPLTVVTVTGTIAGDGTMSGTWSDNYQNGTRTGTWMTTLGEATQLGVDYTVTPWLYPSDTTLALSQWVSYYPAGFTPLDKELCKKDGWKTINFGTGHGTFKNQGQCVSYADNYNADHAQYYLALEKNTATTNEVAAGATIDLASNITLTELGFDYKGYCGAGAPRYNVYTTAGTYYFFGCTYGTHTAVADGWTQVRFTDADAYPADGTTVFPGFGSVEVTGIEIVMDEEGQTQLDNIDINGTIVGNP